MHFTSNWEQLPAVLVRFTLIFLLFGLIFFVARLSFLFVYAERCWASLFHPDLPKALLSCFGYDGAVLTYSRFDSNALAQNFALNEFSTAFYSLGKVDIGSNRMAAWGKKTESVSCFWLGNPYHALFLSKNGTFEENSHVFQKRALAYTALMTYLIQRECAGLTFFKDRKPRTI